MKKFFLFFAAALLCANVSADQAVTINYSGNATQGHFPVYGQNADNEGQKVQAIYLADQLKGIAVGSEIKALTLLRNGSKRDRQSDFQDRLCSSERALD